MKFSVMHPSKLSDTQVEAWRGLCVSQPQLDTPFLRPEFAMAVGRVRDDARVAAIDHPEDGPAFFAFQAARSKAKPIGGRLSDYQAIVAPADYPLSPESLLQGCGLGCFHFDHLIDPTGAFSAWTTFSDESPVIDLPEGFEAYADNNAKGSRELKETMRKRRKLEREAGEIEFRPNDESQDAWDKLVEWKAHQYLSTKITNVISIGWVQGVLQEIRRQRDEFSGILSSLYAGGKLLAVHFGMASDGVLHYWFPAYEPSELASKCSPGRVLLLEMTRAAKSMGVRKIDLGRGVARYKRSAMTSAQRVHVGVVDLQPIRRVMRTGWHATRDWLKRTPLRYPLKAPARMAYRLREWMQFR